MFLRLKIKNEKKTSLINLDNVVYFHPIHSAQEFDTTVIFNNNTSIVVTSSLDLIEEEINRTISANAYLASEGSKRFEDFLTT